MVFSCQLLLCSKDLRSLRAAFFSWRFFFSWGSVFLKRSSRLLCQKVMQMKPPASRSLLSGSSHSASQLFHCTHAPRINLEPVSSARLFRARSEAIWECWSFTRQPNTSAKLNRPLQKARVPVWDILEALKQLNKKEREASEPCSLPLNSRRARVRLIPFIKKRKKKSL